MILQLLQTIRTVFQNQHRFRKTLTAFSGTVLLTSIVATSLLTIVRGLGGLESFELSAYDTLIRLRPDEGIDDRILVVGISEEDIQTRREYPIEDGTLAQLLQTLETYQPRAIGIDIARDIPQGDGREALVQALQSDRIIAACQLSSSNEPGISPPPGVPPERVGFVDFPQDASGLIRRSILVSVPAPTRVGIPEPHLCNDANPENQLVSFGLTIVLKYLQSENIAVQPTEAGDIQIGSTVFHRLGERVAGGYHFTGATDYQILLNYRSPENPARFASLTDVLDGKVNPDWVRDRIVLIGYTSQVAKDAFLTPYSAGSERDGREMPGVVVHAQNVSQILSAVLNQRPLIWYWSPGIELLWIWGWSLAGGLVAWLVRKPLLLVVAEGISIAIVSGICYLIFLNGGWVPLVPSAIALVITGVGVLLVDRAHESGYTQAIYEQIRDQVAKPKTTLKPQIEIDEDKRAKQVAEITQSSYFQDLQERAKQIRERRRLEQASAANPTSSEP